MLRPGVTLLARLMTLTVVIEAGNSKPGTIRRSLTCLGIKMRGKGILFGKLSTIALQIVLGDTTFVHPQAQARVADELADSYGFIDSSILLFGTIYFVLIDQHTPSPTCLSDIS